MIGELMHTPRRRLAAGVLGAVTALGLAVTPAHASPLGITFMFCQGLGANLMECSVSVTGGVGSYTYRWSSTTEDSDDVVFPCSTGFPPTGTESLTVTDSVGDAVSVSRDFTCIGGPER
jgi:hypothetical protein